MDTPDRKTKSNATRIVLFLSKTGITDPKKVLAKVPLRASGFISPELMTNPPFPFSFSKSVYLALQPPSDAELQVRPLNLGSRVQGSGFQVQGG